MHNLWVLPGHIIVSLDEGHKLFAYDLLPKHSPWPNTSDFLMSNHVDKRKGKFILLLMPVFKEDTFG